MRARLGAGDCTFARMRPNSYPLGATVRPVGLMRCTPGHAGHRNRPTSTPGAARPDWARQALGARARVPHPGAGRGLPLVAAMPHPMAPRPMKATVFSLDMRYF